ncbi:MAG: Pyruvate/2-oxoglutarate dehydrogenase complex (E3) component Lpd [Candidatus Methanohalarchaeum thermophilum]|uniref:Pyruvate/2-oxoglutarate dehydrogenase complex (E3) component Lpd n=1 Tax=Methanohalarchaeum thermophilum TaxID=1903181 RepID=A0A1Q6DV71_METT1|nr:MAG: Pyruvate/2-oxoglutarate dehydrogenase complex (E3) component Lpd [Candidatus Methanohalarchaeum thermophilum]
MKEYDTIVIGGGSGTSIVEASLNHGKKTALIEKNYLGGTCLNVGCIPSKMLIYPADLIKKIQESKKLGINAKIDNIEFKSIMERIRTSIKDSRKEMYQGIQDINKLDFYEKKATFKSNHKISIGNKDIYGEKIFLATGGRPSIPPIEGIREIDYLTNETILQLNEKPKSVVIVGGGYIAAEYGHFLNAIGTAVKIIQRNNYLIPREDRDISKALTEQYSKEMEVSLGTEVVEIEEKEEDNEKKVYGEKGDEKKEFIGEEILLATGRKSNADLLEIENTEIETDDRNYIKVDKKMQTSVEGIWAIGDAIGKEMFKHTANREARIAARNAFHKDKISIDYSSAPHAVYSYPKIGSVGIKEENAPDEVLVGKSKYMDVAKGEAMDEREGFAKAIVDKENGKILGFHIFGPYAPMLIQEVINVMSNNGKVNSIYSGLHIHPALPELITSTLGNLREK